MLYATLPVQDQPKFRHALSPPEGFFPDHWSSEIGKDSGEKTDKNIVSDVSVEGESRIIIQKAIEYTAFMSKYVRVQALK